MKTVCIKHVDGSFTTHRIASAAVVIAPHNSPTVYVVASLYFYGEYDTLGECFLKAGELALAGHILHLYVLPL